LMLMKWKSSPQALSARNRIWIKKHICYFEETIFGGVLV